MERIEKLLRKLENVTSEKRIIWKCLPKYLEEKNNEPLRKYIINNKKKFYSTYGHDNLDEYSSYCAEFNGGCFIILSYNGKWGYNIMCAQNSDNSRIVELNIKEEYQMDIKLLLSCIKKSMDNVDDLINDMLNY